MHVKFVSVTQSWVDGAQLTAEELLVYIARVSNPSNQANRETASGLLRYMIRNKHWSPFDMANLTVEVKTSKAISIQILRHWSIKPQEFSQRYAEVEEIEPIELRAKADKDRQSSEEVIDPEMCVDDDRPDIMWYNSDDTPMHASDRIRVHLQDTMRLYKQLLNKGIAKECARMILPMAATTTLYLNGSIRSWIHYLAQRTDKHAQKEHREVAVKIKEIFGQHFPNVLKAVEELAQ